MATSASHSTRTRSIGPATRTGEPSTARRATPRVSPSLGNRLSPRNAPKMPTGRRRPSDGSESPEPGGRSAARRAVPPRPPAGLDPAERRLPGRGRLAGLGAPLPDRDAPDPEPVPPCAADPGSVRRPIRGLVCPPEERPPPPEDPDEVGRSEEHTPELQSR